MLVLDRVLHILWPSISHMFFVVEVRDIDVIGVRTHKARYIARWRLSAYSLEHRSSSVLVVLPSPKRIIHFHSSGHISHNIASFLLREANNEFGCIASAWIVKCRPQRMGLAVWLSL